MIVKNFIKKLSIVFVGIALAFTVAACREEEDVISLAEGDWESQVFHNRVMGFIFEHGYGAEWEDVQADTPVVVQSLRTGDIDVNSEMWSDNVTSYQDDLEAGYYHEIATNFDDNFQGLWIPGYLQDDYEIYTVFDLIEHKEMFYSTEVADEKGIVHGGPSGWAATNFLQNKFNNEEIYGDLSDAFEFYPLESTATLNVTLVDAYESEEAWVGYHWTPTWPHAEMDLRLLEDPYEYDYDEGTGNIPPTPVTVVVTDGFEERYPEIFEFLSNYETSADITSEALVLMDELDDAMEAAKEWLRNNEDIWTPWVPEDVADNVRDALQ